MNAVRSLSSKGQVVVPKKIRNYLGAKEGDQVQFTINEKGEVVVTILKETDVMDLFGSMPPKEQTDKEMDQIVKEAREEHVDKRRKEGKL